MTNSIHLEENLGCLNPDTLPALPQTVVYMMASSQQTTELPQDNIKQSSPVATTNDGTSRITTDGSIVQSSDPTVAPNATVSQKLKGDVAGAMKGTAGSLEAATGAVFRNENLEQKGLDKMQDEDERLAAKRGVMPVGSNLRESKQDA